MKKHPGYTIRDQKTWSVQGIDIGYMNSEIDGFQTIQSSSYRDTVRLHFGIKGDYKFTHKQLRSSYDLIGGHHNILFSPKFSIEVVNKTLFIETFGVQFPRTLFLKIIEFGHPMTDQFLNKLIQNEAAILSEKWGTIDASIQSTLDQMRNNQYLGSLQKTFLFSKCFELLVLCIENISKINADSFFSSKAEKEKIMAARDFLNARLDDPPTLLEVSKHVGLNIYKLKKGFKEMFNETVFGYLSKRRMNLAYQLLINSSKSISEVAFELGYSSPQHFSGQFKNKFGNSPKFIRKNPKLVSKS